MLKHIVWWTLKDEAEGNTAKENAKIVKALGEALATKIDTVKSIEIGIQIESTTTVDVQVVLQSTHENTQALEAYSQHPEHLKFGEFIKKVVSSRSAIDYTV